MISQEARAERERLLAADRQPDPPPAKLRRDWEAEARQQVLPRDARFSLVSADGVAAEWMETPRVWKDRVLLLLHGGGFVAGSPRTHRQMAADLSRATQMRVLVPEYRLAPEHPFPAGLQDALRAYGWLLKLGMSEDQIVVAGDSAGGGMALSLLLALRDAGAEGPRGAVLLSPWTDLTCSTPSHSKNRKYDPSISRDDLLESARAYAARRNPAEPMISPHFAKLGGLPPLLIHVGSEEVLLDDSRAVAQKVREAGGEAVLKIWEGMWHVFHAYGTNLPESRQAVDEIGSHVKRLFAPPETQAVSA